MIGKYETGADRELIIFFKKNLKLNTVCNECLKWELITLLRSALYAVISHLRRCAEHAVIILLRHAERVVIASELLLTRNVVLSFYYDVHARRD